MAWDQWKHWNEVLHEEGRVVALKDLPHINREIQQELKLGPMDLLFGQYFYFLVECEDFMKLTLEYRSKCLWKAITAQKRTKR